MDKRPLIGVSICAVILLILASLSNVVGYQTVQSSNQKMINTEINEKDLLFQTIVDIANNKEIQRIILKPQINKAGFLNPDVKFSVLTSQVLTKHQLRQMYFIGLMLSKIISKSRMQSMVHKYQLGNQEMQKELSAVIEKDATLNEEMTQLSRLKCDCGNEDTSWNFPILCTLLLAIIWYIIIIQLFAEFIFHFDPLFFDFLLGIVGHIGQKLNCSWAFLWMERTFCGTYSYFSMAY